MHLPKNWREALLGLVSSRLTLIRLESKEAAASGAKRAILVILALGSLFFGWLLFLAGIVACIASVAGWPWFWVALGAAALHFIISAICIMIAKSGGKATFIHTRNEFQKDREWIAKFQDNSRSSN
jgi:uncharacterized membrane protein YqjE